MPGIYADYGGCGYDVHLPAVTEPVNPGWRDVVISYAAYRKYGGFHPTLYPRGNERRYMSYQEDVNLSIFMCQGPRASQAQVQGMVEKDGKLPLKRDLYCKLHEDITTRPVQFWIAGYEDV
jgi:hypothetical protein